MYRCIIFWYKDYANVPWTLGLIFENVDIYYEKQLRKDHPFVRMELKRKDSKRLFVWEWIEDKLSTYPYDGRYNRKKEPIAINPDLFREYGFKMENYKYL